MTCTRCDGAGFCFVSPEWVDQQVPPDPVPGLTLLALHREARELELGHQRIPIELAARLQAAQLAADEHESKRAEAANTVYPCPGCRTEQFKRWRHRHLDSTHDRSTCPECRSAGVAPKNRTRTT